MKKHIDRLLCGSLAWAIFVGPNNSALSQVLKLNCAQQSRHMCEQGKGCKVLQDASTNQWAFELDIEKQTGRVFRCAGRDCRSPFEVRVLSRLTGEIHFWEPIANEVFSISPDHREFSHSETVAWGHGGHIVSEFGYCTSGQ